MIAAALTAALALAGCSRAEPDPVADVPAFAVDSPAVTLVTPGDNPRVLEYADHAGDNGDEGPWGTTAAVYGGIDQSVHNASGLSPDAPAGGDVNRVTLPLSVTFGPAPAPGDGENPADRRVDLTVGPGTHSDLALGQEVATAEGFLMSWRAASSGRVDTLKLLAPPESSTTGRSIVESSLLSLMSASVVFPAEPVGVGGVWTVSSRVTGDTSMLRTTTYTVTGAEGDTVSLDVSVEERPTQPELTIDNEIAGDLDGATLTVENSSTTSEGSLTVDLRRPLPVSGRVSATTRVIYAGPRPEARVVQDITSAVEFGV